MKPQLFGSTHFNMGKFKNWLITKLLEKDKLVCVPQSWQKDYVRLAGDKVQNKQIIASLITEYNGLLRDYFNKCTIEELTEELSHLAEKNVEKSEINRHFCLFAISKAINAIFSDFICHKAQFAPRNLLFHRFLPCGNNNIRPPRLSERAAFRLSAPRTSSLW